ncbi:MAG: arginase [Eubacteriales bacterium]|nr:arginase [Eubacteriales bacterium]
MYHIFGCPMHFGVGDKGLTYSLNYLNNYCRNLNINMLPEITMPEENLPNLKNLNSVLATCSQIAENGYAALERGDTPLFIAGDHSSVIGSVSAAGTYYDNLGLIWIDAHPDINTDTTTVSGNIHGMPVAALLGMGEKRLTQILSSRPKLKAANIVMLGLRDIDPPEARFLKDLHIKYYTYRQIMRLGIRNCLDECITYLSGLEHVHISFDVDVMDPALLPGVSVPVPEGFKEDEAFLIMDGLMDGLPISSYDIVEYNAEHDMNDQTAEFVRKLAHRILAHG